MTRGLGPKRIVSTCRNHRFDKRIPYLGGRGYMLKCRCGKVKKAWGLYDRRLPADRQSTTDDQQ